MTLDQAIQILNNLRLQTDPDHGNDEFIALWLGIEALKEVRRHRRPTSLAAIWRLPGETYE